jgi:predicted RND superfamily exporter protein/outer membrane lipoprotein-sorting protein
LKHYAHWLLKFRLAIIAVIIAITGVMGYFCSGMKIIIDPTTLAPQGHQYIKDTNEIDRKFGSKYMVLIGITPKKGDVLQPSVLRSVERLTRKLEATPGVVKSTLLSLSARQVKAIKGTSEGFEARALMEKAPLNPDDAKKLKVLIEANPTYLNTIVSPDFKTTAVIVELKERSDGFRAMMASVKAIVEEERSEEVDISLGGSPVYYDRTEQLSERMGFLFPLALLVIGLLHFEAFRSKQGLILPLVTALMAVIWGTGFIGLSGRQLDIFNSPTPILILAIAAGHAVQLLKRYYEEYRLLRQADGSMSPLEASHEAIVRSLVGVGPVMLIAGGIAALGFFSLLAFKIETIRSFGLFTGVGILSAVVLEMTFIPAVRSLLRPPKFEPDLSHGGIWETLTTWASAQVIPAHRRKVTVGVLALFAMLCLLGMSQVFVDNSSRSLFSRAIDIQKDDAFLNRQLGGTNSLYVMVEGPGPDAIKSPQLLKAMESLQRIAERHAYVGKTVSIVDYLKRMNLAMHADEPSQNVLPSTKELVSQYLLLYSLSGDPEDFNSLVDYQYQAAKITVLLKTDKNADIKALLNELGTASKELFGPTVKVRFGGDVTQNVALTETMVEGKILNILQIGGTIFVISALVFRSLLAGVIVLLPLIMTVLAIFGSMGALGIPLNIPNALISAMAVGIGADYAIYLLYRMRELASRGEHLEAVVHHTLKTAGKATLFVATAVAGGYGVLSLSFDYNVHKWLSMFIVLAMIVSAWTSLTLVPSLVMYLQPAFIFKRSAKAASWHFPVLLTLIAVMVFAGARLAHAETTVTPLDIMRRNEAVNKTKLSTASATFTLTEKSGAQRVRKTTGYTRLQINAKDNMRLVRFTAPADIRGTSTLLIEHMDGDDDMWVFLPALGKVRRLSVANKKDSFFGTDLSYGDVIGYRPDEWKHTLLREESFDGAPCYVVESVPLTEATRNNTGYGKRLSWIRKDNLVALKIDIWDGSNIPLKRILSKDVRSFGDGKDWQAMLTNIENLQTGHQTAVQYDSFRTDQSLSEHQFSAAELDK